MSTRVITHLVMGFLGAGKTTLLRHLLAHKPEQERWAILVNEFGEVRVDGALLSAQGALADVIVANKSDLASPEQLAQLSHDISQKQLCCCNSNC